jgi:hypothetical protein
MRGEPFVCLRHMLELHCELLWNSEASEPFEDDPDADTERFSGLRQWSVRGLFSEQSAVVSSPLYRSCFREPKLRVLS